MNDFLIYILSIILSIFKYIGNVFLVFRSIFPEYL